MVWINKVSIYTEVIAKILRLLPTFVGRSEDSEWSLEVTSIIFGLSGSSDGKESAYNVGDLGSIPRLGRSPGEGNGNHSSILA